LLALTLWQPASELEERLRAIFGVKELAVGGGGHAVLASCIVTVTATVMGGENIDGPKCCVQGPSAIWNQRTGSPRCQRHPWSVLLGHGTPGRPAGWLFCWMYSSTSTSISFPPAFPCSAFCRLFWKVEALGCCCLESFAAQSASSGLHL
jgi:hypothetical protein